MMCHHSSFHCGLPSLTSDHCNATSEKLLHCRVIPFPVGLDVSSADENIHGQDIRHILSLAVVFSVIKRRQEQELQANGKDLLVIHPLLIFLPFLSSKRAANVSIT